MNNVVNRVPSPDKVNRKEIVLEGTSTLETLEDVINFLKSAFYGTINYADDPLEIGTAINKILFDSIKADFDDILLSIENIINGITVVGKSKQDKDGNDIDTTYLKVDRIGQPDGPASLDSNGKLLESQLPEIPKQEVTWKDIVDKPNILTSLTASATDDDLVSAKCVYDIIGNVETLISQI